MLALVIMGAVLALGVMSFGLWVMSVAAEAPPIDELQPVDTGANSIILAADGSRLGYIQSDEARTPVKLENIPEELQKSTVAIEDERFYDHNGVDLEGVARAAFENLEAGEVKQGGSTITMQLARNLYIEDPERDLERKIKEAKLAQELEEQHSKEWILEQYLNSASYGTVNGRTAVGVEAAAQIYFAKPVRDLNLTESATLAGLPQSPSQYNPLQNPRSALDRRNDVLEEMAKQGLIEDDEADVAKAEPLGLDPGNRYSKIEEPYFFDFVEQQLIERYGVNTVRQGGLRVHTTINPDLQEAGRAAIEGQLPYSDDPSAAVVSIDPSTGFVKAMASSGRYSDAQFNLAAQGHRQPGSAFKTFALTTAVKRGINPDSTYYTSQPLDLDLPEWGHWEVVTYGESYAGTISLHDATVASDNTVFAQLALDLGPESVADTAHEMGIESELDGIPAETLGGLRIGVSPLEMATAYATLASGGIRNKPIAIRKVVFPTGEVDDVGEPQRNRVFDDGVASEVTQILQDNVDGGTGTAAQTSNCSHTAGKTGTTDDFNDAMFIGYTPNLSTAVWVGYPDALRSMTSVHGVSVAGGTFPAQIWHDYSEVALSGGCPAFPEPQNPVEWIPFHGSYSSDSGSSSCSEVTGSGASEGSYSCDSDADYVPAPSEDDGESGAYAPGRGQKPAPSPKPKPPAPPPAPPAPTPE
ncbi:MAG: transglycosylase domain-containing protein, partial [Solirubrobacterales bacterium]